MKKNNDKDNFINNIVQFIKDEQDGKNHGEKKFSEWRDRLRSGVKILGWEIKIDREKQRRGNSQTSYEINDPAFHPLFFCFNTTELIVFLKSLFNNSKSSISKDILKMVYAQLSEYAKDKINEEMEKMDAEREMDYFRSLSQTAPRPLKNRLESELYPTYKRPEIFTTTNFDSFIIDHYIKKSLVVEVSIDNTYETFKGTIGFGSRDNIIKVVLLDSKGVKEIDKSQILEITPIKRP